MRANHSSPTDLQTENQRLRQALRNIMCMRDEILMQYARPMAVHALAPDDYPDPASKSH